MNYIFVLEDMYWSVVLSSLVVYRHVRSQLNNGFERSLAMDSGMAFQSPPVFRFRWLETKFLLKAAVCNCEVDRPALWPWYGKTICSSWRAAAVVNAGDSSPTHMICA